jgi:hypothetical protein
MYTADDQVDISSTLYVTNTWLNFVLTNLQDAVGIQRGIRKILGAIKIGEQSIKTSMREQLSELKSDASKHKSIAGGDSSNAYPSKSFPARSFTRQTDIGSHHWRDRITFRYEANCYAGNGSGQATWIQGLRRTVEGGLSLVSGSMLT